jgi:hypothetical protein
LSGDAFSVMSRRLWSPGLLGHSVMPNYSENYGDFLVYVRKKLYFCANSSWEVRLSDVRY